MPEMRYTVAVTFPNESIAPQWLDWLRNGHIAAVIAGGATSAEAFQIDGKPNAYCVTYRFPDRASFERYEREFAPALRAEGQQLFPAASGIVYAREMAEVLLSM
jgi:hypothetical protein